MSSMPIDSPPIEQSAREARCSGAADREVGSSEGCLREGERGPRKGGSRVKAGKESGGARAHARAHAYAARVVGSCAEGAVRTIPARTSAQMNMVRPLSPESGVVAC